MRVLTLFLSSGKSLLSWHKDGILSREILIYRDLLKSGTFDRIQIFSYDAADREFVAELAGKTDFYRNIDVLAPDKGKLGGIWGLAGVLKHRARIARSTALKTNQVSGAWAAWLAAGISGVPLAFRMGYLLSRRFALNRQKFKAWVAQLVERAVARRAARIVVTSEEVATHFRSVPSLARKVVHLPTYVDTSIFEPKVDYDFGAPAITVARLRPQKNLAAMIKGCALAGCDLVIVGTGELEQELRELASGLPISVEFVAQMDNVELAWRLRQHSLFLLTSLHEGLPKALIEAMSVGLVAIGTPISGITDLIVDGETGYLTEGSDPESIAAAINRARTFADAEVGKRARKVIAKKFGLERYVAAESAMFAQISG